MGMMNFSGKGNSGWFSGGNNGGGHGYVKQPSQGRETRVDPADNKTATIDFWYEYALGLKAGMKDLIEVKDEAQRIYLERRAINAGLRAVIRDLLKVLRETSPNHPLLDKKNRDRIFAEFEKAEMSKALQDTNKQPWQPRERPLENTSE
jgi:hypothetical protein